MAKKWKFVTSEEDFKAFQEEVLYWQKYFGLLDWEIECFHEKISSRARIHYQFSQRRAEIYLNVEYPVKPYHRDICDSAFHEICELLLGGMASFMQGSESACDEMVHSVIQTLCNTLFLEHYEKRFNNSWKECLRRTK